MDQLLLSTKNLKIDINNEILLKNINLSINKFDKIGLIGKNGSGKSTLLKTLSNKITSYTGNINSKKSIYYLPQVDEKYFTSEVSIYDYIKNISEEIFNIPLDIDNFELPIHTLSGGEFLKLHIEIIRYIHPDLLLLDEPTNNLDLVNLKDLKDFLLKEEITFVLVSHNFNFLNQVVNKIWDIEDQEIISFTGNLDLYLKEKDNLRNSKEEDYQSKYKEITRLKKTNMKNIAMADKFPKKLKKLRKNENDHNIISGFKLSANKSKGIADKAINKKLEKKYSELEKLESIHHKNINPLLLDSNRKQNNLLIKIDNSNLSVNDKILINNINLKIYYGERILISGNNGVGKSTLIKAIFENNKSIKLSPTAYLIDNIKFSYLSQKYTNIKYDLNIEQNMLNTNKDISYTIIRQQLGNYLFYTKEEIQKKVRFLSGGEIARLSFAIETAQYTDLLILDEPTNNLDVETKNILINNLSFFKGSIILISHDADFIDKLNMNKSYLIENCKFNECELNILINKQDK